MEDKWISLTPPKNESTPALKSLSGYLDANYRLSSVYPYKNASGDTIFYTLGIESTEEGKKIVLPLSYGKNHPNSEPAWALKQHAEKNNILYNEHLLHQNKPVLI